MPSAFYHYLNQVRPEHSTQHYQSDELIVRRGFPVRLSSGETTVSLTPHSAHPDHQGNAAEPFDVSIDTPYNGWSLAADEDDLILHIPPNAIVGMYILTAGDKRDNMVVLFNPWCEEDEVYLPDEQERQEYVLNDAGRIWVGTAESFASRPWYFGQFSVTSLLAAFDLIDRMQSEDRRSVISVTRHLSAIINSQDDGGAIIGNWSNDYSDGTSPLAWTGSTEILERFWKERQPVKYGQCWVFSGVFTTVMRALGIPSKSITNFNSAHDSTRPYNRSVDKYFDAQGKLIPEHSRDSIWNFHVWNEAYMRRPDLAEIASSTGVDFNGWQAVDSTPQEASHGLYQMGPTPVSAVKDGVNVDYDTDFVIGEVNADILHYWQNEDGEFVLRGKHQRHVGKNISTKAVGSDSRNDITHEYKYPEGSAEEREALARRPSAAAEAEVSNEDLSFAAIVPANAQVGDTVSAVVEVTSSSDEYRTVLVRSLCRIIDYTGVPRHTVDEKVENLAIEPGTASSMQLDVTPEEYYPYLGTGAPALQFYTSGKVEETGQTWSWERVVHLDSNKLLSIHAPPSLAVNEETEIRVVINNRTEYLLTGVVLRFEGLSRRVMYELDSIEPGGELSISIDVLAFEVGDRWLIATLDTHEIKDISTSAHIEVTA